MNTSIPTVKQLADEAEFQLLAAKDQIEWFAAIARAIARDVEHHKGHDVRILSGLLSYLDDTCLAGIESAISQFQKVAATQKPASQNVSRHAEVQP